LRHLNELKSRIEEIRNRIPTLKAEIQQINQELKSIVAEYLKLKESMQTLKQQRDELVKKLVLLKQERDRIREEANSYHQLYISLLSEERAIREELERVSILLKAKELARYIDERRRMLYGKALEVFEKYQKGEPITLDEYKLLAEFNMINLKRE
jgi:uncharacterized coiled-coil DUF342 family protein